MATAQNHARSGPIRYHWFMRKLGAALIVLGVLDLLFAAGGLMMYAIASGSEYVSLNYLVLDAQPALADDPARLDECRRRILTIQGRSSDVALVILIVLALTGVLTIILGMCVRRSAAPLDHSAAASPPLPGTSEP